MKLPSASLIVLVLSPLGQPQTAENVCRSGEVEIPVSFRFANQAFRAEWAYRGLEPGLALHDQVTRDGLVIRDEGGVFPPQVERVSADRLEAVFCLSPKIVPRPNRTFVVRIGPRRLIAASRPVLWRAEVVFVGKRTFGRMPSIHFDAQPDPDWLIVRSAVWLLTSEGYPRLDIELYNTGPVVHPGTEILLVATDRETLCISTPVRTAVVPIAFKVIKGDLFVESADPQFGELIERAVETQKGGCDETIVEAPVGPTGSLTAGEVLRIRYTFQEKADPKTIGKFTIHPKTGTMYGTQKGIHPIHQLPFRRIEFTGPFVYPKRIFITRGNRPF